MEIRTKEQQNRLELVVLLCVFALSVYVHFRLNNYVKALESYPDELLYYGIARSLFQGKGMAARNVLIGFQKIMYSLVLMPTFAVANGYFRLKVINLVNCALMSSCVFPAWLIAKELRLECRDRLAITLIVCVWPDMLFSMTFMSENAYWPVTLWCTYFWVLNARRQSYGLSLLQGILCYVGYLTKEVFLAVPLAMLCFEVVYPIVSRLFPGKGVPAQKVNVSRKIAMTGIFLLTFGACYVVGRELLFSRFVNPYAAAVDTSLISSSSSILYLFYGVFYLFAAVVLSCFILPFALPIAHFRLLDEENRRLFVYAILQLCVSAATVSFTITLREDFGKMMPSIHIRYLGSMLVLFFIPFLRALGLDDADDRRRFNRRTAIALVLLSLFVVVLFKGTTVRSAVEQYTLQWYLHVQERLSGCVPGYSGGWMPGADVLLIDVGILVVVAVLFLLYCKNTQMMRGVFLAGVIVVSVVNYYVGKQFIAPAYAMPTSMVDSVEQLDNWFVDLGPDETKLYVTNGNGVSPYMQCLETYFDDMDGFYMINGDDLKTMAKNGAKVADLQFTEPLWRQRYAPVDAIDYLVVGNDVDLGEYQVDNLEELPELASSFYRVYRNLKPDTLSVSLRQNLASDGMTIFLDGPYYNADQYIPEGISWPEDGYTWTNGDRMKVDVPIGRAGELLDVRIHVVSTFNGVKSYEVYDADGAMVTSGGFEGPGYIAFTLAAREDGLNFEVAFPDAQVVKDTLTNTTDDRKIAFMLNWITVDRRKEQ